MGQKVHPRGFRLGVIESSDSKWFARRDYRDYYLNKGWGARAFAQPERQIALSLALASPSSAQQTTVLRAARLIDCESLWPIS